MSAEQQKPVQPAKYQQWETVGEEKVLSYPDFRLHFVKQEPGPLYPGSTTRRLGPSSFFRITHGGEDVEVRWSPGTGELTGQPFRVGGKEYILEMMISVFQKRHGGEYEVVISPAQAWEKVRFGVNREG
ncbi:hypothetical protein MRY87_05815 [bacterium]|nr:hypothetical protein [bacterium]